MNCTFLMSAIIDELLSEEEAKETLFMKEVQMYGRWRNIAISYYANRIYAHRKSKQVHDSKMLHL